MPRIEITSIGWPHSPDSRKGVQYDRERVHVKIESTLGGICPVANLEMPASGPRQGYDRFFGIPRYFFPAMGDGGLVLGDLKRRPSVSTRTALL
jgi:hypothetical protein